MSTAYHLKEQQKWNGRLWVLMAIEYMALITRDPKLILTVSIPAGFVAILCVMFSVQHAWQVRFCKPERPCGSDHQTKK